MASYQPYIHLGTSVQNGKLPWSHDNPPLKRPGGFIKSRNRDSTETGTSGHQCTSVLILFTSAWSIAFHTLTNHVKMLLNTCVGIYLHHHCRHRVPDSSHVLGKKALSEIFSKSPTPMPLSSDVRKVSSIYLSIYLRYSLKQSYRLIVYILSCSLPSPLKEDLFNKSLEFFTQSL